MHHWCRLSAVVFGSALARCAIAQQPPTASIPIRDLSAPVFAKDTVKIPAGIKQFADGRVMLNDPLAKRIVMYDATMSNPQNVADSTGKPALYPNSFLITSLFDYPGDSALFPDYTSQVFLVIEPGGKVGRALALPKPSDMRLLSQPYVGNPTFDHKGRFVYRAQQPFRSAAASAGQPPRSRDTISIVRQDFETRSVDTITSVSIPVNVNSPVVWSDKGVASAHRVINPLPLAPDEWAVTTDGSIAVLKGSDYHIDWVYPDGTKKSTPKMPFDWRRLTDADKQARIDSVKQVIDSLSKAGRPFGMIIAGRAGQVKPDTVIPTIEFVPLDSMPDYVPPFRAGSLRADRDNHLWVPPTTSSIAAGNNVIYDVINTKGEIIERVRVPADRLIVGFGPGGVVYLVKGEREKGYVLERRQVLRPGVRAQ